MSDYIACVTSRYRVKIHRKESIAIPAKVRRSLGITKGSFLNLIVESDGIHIVMPRSLRI